MAKLPAADRVRSLFDYDQQTGYLTWRPREPITKQDKRFNSLFAGKRAGTLDSWGHRQIKIDGVLHLAHRLIWVWMTGEPPEDQIDHMDGDRDHNAWDNLREATAQQNSWNRKPAHFSRTETLGVHFRKDRASRPYAAKIRVNGEAVHLGFFDTVEEARDAYQAAFVKYRDAAWLRPD